MQNWYSYQYTCLQIIEFIKSKPRFTELLMTHLGTSAIMDLLLRLITMVEGTENKQNILSVSIKASKSNCSNIQCVPILGVQK